MPVEFLQAEPTIQTFGEVVRDAQRITWRARPSGVVFSLVFAPYPTDPTGAVIWTAAAINNQAEYWASIYDALSGLPHVSGVGQIQEVDALNELQDHTLIAIRSTSGLSGTTLNVLTEELLGNTVAGQITSTVAELDAIEGAT